MCSRTHAHARTCTRIHLTNHFLRSDFGRCARCSRTQALAYSVLVYHRSRSSFSCDRFEGGSVCVLCVCVRVCMRARGGFEWVSVCGGWWSLVVAAKNESQNGLMETSWDSKKYNSRQPKTICNPSHRDGRRIARLNRTHSGREYLKVPVDMHC